MNEAMHFLFQHVDSGRNVINELNLFWANMTFKPNEQVLAELADQWRTLLKIVQNETTALQLMSVAAFVPLLNEDSFVPTRLMPEAGRRMALLQSLDGFLPGNTIPQVYDIGQLFNIHVTQDQAVALLQSMNEFDL